MMQVFRALVVFIHLGFSTVVIAGELRIAVTTSFNNSGLSDVLLPEAEKDLGLRVKLLVVGTGQALKLARAGDVDAILVHSRKAEEAFVEEGFATHRREIMYNDFVLIGPRQDPVGITDADSVSIAFRKIADRRAPFISRGDDSGTHRKEISIWELTGLNNAAFTADWYLEVGAGMGAALNTASAVNAYILSDRASWLKFGNKGNLELLYAGDSALFNQYAFLPVNPARHSHVHHADVLKFEQWLVGEKAQSIIGRYRIDGELLFVPNANKITQK